MAKDRKAVKSSTPVDKRKSSAFDDDIRFVVPMPGRSAWHSQYTQPSFKKLNTFSNPSADFALEDYQAELLMQREYLID